MRKRLLTAIAAGAATVLALASCSSGGSSGTDNGDKKDLTIGVFTGWAEDIAASYLWQAILEKKGYDVELESGTAGPVFAGISQGSYDLILDVSLPAVHKEYWDKYGDKLVDLGPWFDKVLLALAVNKDAPIDSITELAENADKFDNRIVGIEPGAGETGLMKDSVIPAYGLEDMKFVTSSTPAMLAALKKAIKDGDNIVVTLWKPHWAYKAFPIRNLEDPKVAFKKPDSIHAAGREGFTDDYPQLTKWMKDFKFPPDKMMDLENDMFNPAHDKSEYPGIVKKWMSENKDFVKGLTD